MPLSPLYLGRRQIASKADIRANAAKANFVRTADLYAKRSESLLSAHPVKRCACEARDRDRPLRGWDRYSGWWCRSLQGQYSRAAMPHVDFEPISTSILRGLNGVIGPLQTVKPDATAAGVIA